MRRPLRVAACTGALALSLASGGLARADDAPPSPSPPSSTDAQALELFEKSEVAYDAGRFADAIALLRRSYELKKEPVLLYNLGRAYEGLGDLAAAAQSYEAFLAAQPNTPDRGALQRRIATLRRQLEERDALRRQALERKNQEQKRSASAVPWVVASVGAVGLAGGGVFALLASKRNDDAMSEPTYAEADRLHAQARTYATAANVAFIAGGTLLVAGVIWGILDLSASKKQSTTGLAPALDSQASLGSFTF